MHGDNKCMDMAHVCMSVVVTMLECFIIIYSPISNVYKDTSSVDSCCVEAVVKDSIFFSLDVLKYVVCLYKGYDGCCVFCLYCKAWRYRCSSMGTVRVSSCRWCTFVAFVYPGQLSMLRSAWLAVC